ncbi:glycosyltransferase family protein [Bifidobacterium choloepi]|nr:DUF2142 domain-containing protein [Bifidobacterium choloepi]
MAKHSNGNRQPNRQSYTTEESVESSQRFPFRNFWILPLAYFILTVTAGVPLSLWDTGKADFNDAAAHWERVSMILAGHIVPSISPGNSEYVGYTTSSGFVTLNNTAINSPFLYWPSLLSGGRQQVASVLTLVLSAAVIAVAIWLAQRFQILLFAAAILPATFLMMIYPTADAVTDSTSFLFIGLVLFLLQQPQLRWHHWVALCAVSVMLGQIKMTAIVLILLVLLLIRKLSGWKKFWLMAPVMLAATSSWLWSRQVSWFAPAPFMVSYADYTKLKWECVQQPWAWITSIFKTAFMPLNLSTENVNGIPVNAQRNLTLFTATEGTQLGNVTMVPVLFAIVLLTLYSASLAHLRSWFSNGIAAVVLVGFFVATVTALLISWTGSIGGYAWGMQFRYFLPVIPVAFLLIPRFFRCDRPKFLLWFCGALIAWSYIGTVIAHLW